MVTSVAKACRFVFVASNQEPPTHGISRGYIVISTAMISSLERSGDPVLSASGHILGDQTYGHNTAAVDAVVSLAADHCSETHLHYRTLHQVKCSHDGVSSDRPDPRNWL